MSDGLLRIETDDDSDRARLVGELDLSTYTQALTGLDHLFRAEGDVRLDLTELGFVDSSGIRLFIQLHKALDGKGNLVLVGPPPHVVRVLEIAGLEELGIVVEGATP